MSCGLKTILAHGILVKPKNILGMPNLLKFVLEVMSKKQRLRAGNVKKCIARNALKELIARHELKEWQLAIDFEQIT